MQDDTVDPQAAPFDPGTLTTESESAMRSRHTTIEWQTERRRQRPVFNADFELDPQFEPYTPGGGRQDRFTDSYADLPIYVTRIEDGVLFGQEFVVCDRLEPTLSAQRLFLANLSRITNRLETLRRLDVPAGPTYLVGACAPHNNFYHWCFQCLQGIALLRSVAREQGLDYRIVLPPLDGLRRHSLALLGIGDDECVTLPADRFLSGVSLMYSSATCSDYTFQPSERLIGLLDGYRRRCMDAADPNLPTRFYLSRRDAPKRRALRNEAELAEALAARGCPELVMSELSLEDQVGAFARAECIVAPHGAGLVNLMFAPPGARLLKIMAENYRHGHFFRLAQVRGMSYSQVLARVAQVDPNDERHGSELEVDIDKVLRTLDRKAQTSPRVPTPIGDERRRKTD